MKIIKVECQSDIKDFHDTIRGIYKNDSVWVCPLDVEIEGIFNPERNSSFKKGEAERWVLKDEKGVNIGRISAFYDKNKAFHNDQPTGGVGFFECIDNQEAANLLFDTAKEWLSEKGMQAMDGPINFGENINYWGLLIEGFTHQGYGMQYHHPYYKALFENYGYQIYFEQFTYHKNLNEAFPERQEKFARHVGTKEGFSFEHFSYKQKDKYIQNIVDIFNTVWADFHEDYTPLQYKDINLIFEESKQVIVEEFIWFAYDNGEPVAMVVCFPDVNQVLKKLNGKLTLINKIKFAMNRKKINRARQLITGVIPSHQKTYIVGALFMQMIDALRKNKIQELEMSWVGDYNITVNKIYQMLGLPVIKRHATYRFLFDRNAEFKRFTNEKAPKSEKIHKKEV